MDELADLAERVADRLLADLGDDLRAVSYFDGDDLGVTYMRADVRQRYSREDDRAILKHARDESHTVPSREFDFDDDLRVVSRLFEGMLVSYVFLEPGRGVIVSLEADGEFAYRDVVRRVEALLDRQ